MTTSAFGERVTDGFEHVLHGDLLHSEQSSFQKIDVYLHPFFGRVLTLDGLVQTTEGDEFCYHEMLVHPALASRDTLDSVLVIGGGDGGTLRHVLMHGPTQAVMCEIDERVVRVSREHLAGVSSGAFDDPRTVLVIGDGAEFVHRHDESFDAIIVDSTDPVGPAAVLISEDFYADCRRALRPEGVLVAQTGSPMYQAAELQTAVRNMSAAFGVVETYTGFVPTYPGVLWSFTSATTGEPLSATPTEDVATRLERRGIDTRFYTPELHPSAFVLPAFVRELVAQATPASLPRG